MDFCEILHASKNKTAPGMKSSFSLSEKCSSNQRFACTRFLHLLDMLYQSNDKTPMHLQK